MKRLLLAASFFPLLLSCNSQNDAGPQTNAQHQQHTSAALADEKNTAAQEPAVSYRCEFLFPSGLHKELEPRKLKTDYHLQTDAVCDMTYTDKNTAASLWINLEKNTDTEQVKRLVKNFSYMPGLIGPIDAGDGGYVVRTTEKKSDIITAMFSVGSWKCILESKIKTGTSTDGGILFNDDTLAEIAVAWASQLKDLQQ